MHVQIAKVMTGQMDQLLEDGWVLDTYLLFSSWPDAWALVRDWEPIDPEKKPTDSIHRTQYGMAVVRDMIGFCSDGTLVARRISLYDEDIPAGVIDFLPRRRSLEEITLWSRTGHHRDVVDSVQSLPAPEGCRPCPGQSDLPWGPRTTQVLALFRAREWYLDDVDDDRGEFTFTHGVGSAELDRPRFDQGQSLEPLGILSLSCRVSAGLDMQVESWRVQSGCAAHHGSHQVTSVHDDDLVEILDRFETAATTADLPALAFCLIFGDCSSRELDLSEEYSAAANHTVNPDDAPPPEELP